MLAYRDFRSCCNQFAQIYPKLSAASSFAVTVGQHRLDLVLGHQQLSQQLLHLLLQERYQQLCLISETCEWSALSSRAPRSFGRRGPVDFAGACCACSATDRTESCQTSDERVPGICALRVAPLLYLVSSLALAGGVESRRNCRLLKFNKCG